MKNSDSICAPEENWRGHRAAIVLALLLSFSVVTWAETPQGATSNEQAGELISLDLRNVDISVLINTVGELSGKNIIIDSRVKATVTVASGLLLNRKQFYNLFLSVLEVHNLAVVNLDQSTIMVIPNDAILRDRLFENKPSRLGTLPYVLTAHP